MVCLQSRGSSCLRVSVQLIELSDTETRSAGLVSRPGLATPEHRASNRLLGTPLADFSCDTSTKR